MINAGMLLKQSSIKRCCQQGDFIIWVMFFDVINGAFGVNHISKGAQFDDQYFFHKAHAVPIYPQLTKKRHIKQVLSHTCGESLGQMKDLSLYCSVSTQGQVMESRLELAVLGREMFLSYQAHQ